MQLSFVYVPTADLRRTAAFYRDELGWDEAWREGDDTIAFRIPGGSTQVMVSITDQAPGPMYLVDDLTSWLEQHDGIDVAVERYDIPGGSVIGLRDPAGNSFYVFDQAADD